MQNLADSSDMASYSYPSESGKQASTPVDWMPDEVLVETLRYLPTESLGNARLACRRWSRIGGGLWNLSRIYFRPHSEVVRGFEAIANDPVLAAKVHEFIFDARLFFFSERYQESGADLHPGLEGISQLRGPGMNIEIDCDDGYDEMVRPHRSANINRYNHLYTEQQHILDGQLDFKILSESLPKLSNLKDVLIGPQFPDPLGRKRNYSFAWYGSKSYGLWPDVIEPCTWDHFDYYESQDIVWDARPLQSLLRSISMQDQGIERFQYGQISSPLPATALLTLSVPTKIRSWTSSITCLEIHCTRLPRSICDVPDYRMSSAQVPSFAQVLHNVPNLRHLSLSNITTGSDWESVLCNISWAHLAKLELRRYTLNLDTIKSICFAHKQTLQELTLRKIIGDPPPQLNGWTSLARDLGGCLRLNRVQLGELARVRATPTGMLNRREMNPLCSSILQWVPVVMLDVHEADSKAWPGAPVTMWKRTSGSSTLPETVGGT